MILLALISLAFSTWMAWTLYASLREEKLSGFMDYLSTAWIASGSLAGVATAIVAVFQ
jgi:hypothetical protein